MVRNAHPTWDWSARGVRTAHHSFFGLYIGGLQQGQCHITKKDPTLTATDLSILVADDHPLFRGALQQVISQLYPGATLHEAANVAELQQQAEHHKRSDLLLLDLHMPGALGYSAPRPRSWRSRFPVQIR
jgi:PleD family two-component response regulator